MIPVSTSLMATLAGRFDHIVEERFCDLASLPKVDGLLKPPLEPVAFYKLYSSSPGCGCKRSGCAAQLHRPQAVAKRLIHLAGLIPEPALLPEKLQPRFPGRSEMIARQRACMLSEPGQPGVAGLVLERQPGPDLEFGAAGPLAS